MPNRPVSEIRVDRYWDARDAGAQKKEAADEAEISTRTATRLETKRKNAQDADRRQGADFHAAKRQVASILEPPTYEELTADARAAWDDIEVFALRYYGVILMPFQIQATRRVVDLLATDEEEYVVVNQAPGTGKSWFYTRILLAWMTVRDRSMRGLIGSASDNLAKSYTDVLRSDFTRVEPLEHPVLAKRQGIAVDAEACLVHDFGRFKPDPGEGIWTQSVFRVVQHSGQGALSKEATWRATSLEARFIGNRANICVWDDAYNPSDYRTAEARESLFKTWDDVAEPRVEPGGILLLPMQRLGPDDLSNHCLEKVAVEDDDEDIDEFGLDDDLTARTDLPRKYHHIKFKAHYEENCQGKATHGRDAPAWPEGCLLYPKRLSFRKLATLKANNASNFEVVYQQGDVDPASVLVDPIWVSGGTDRNGMEWPGCWDNDRDLCEVPALTAPTFSVATVDPSPAKFWAIQWWIYHPATEQRFLMDLIRSKLPASGLLDRDDSGQFIGIMESWQRRSEDLGHKITHWIFETNSANRFVLQNRNHEVWRMVNGVQVIRHDTNRNKADKDFGVQTVGTHWKYGRVRLPGKQQTRARFTSLKLVDEVTRYPETKSDDEVMAYWFLEWNLPRISTIEDEDHVAWRPSWMREGEPV